jgi:hypothetical protein
MIASKEMRLKLKFRDQIFKIIFSPFLIFRRLHVKMRQVSAIDCLLILIDVI